MRRPFLLLALVMLATSLCAAQPPTPRPATTQAAISDAAFEAAIDRAMQKQLHDRGFEEILQSVAPRFPLVSVGTEPGQCVWNKVTLNRLGKQVDAFRFRTPADAPRDMVWCFLCNDLRYEWYIIPLSGQMTGFRRNFYYKPEPILGTRTPKGIKDLVLQSLDAASFQSDTEYLVWMEFRHAKPMPTYLAIDFLPAAKDPATIEAPDYILRALDLSPMGPSIDAIAIDRGGSAPQKPLPEKKRRAATTRAKK
jgi:hypothetical protein